MTIRRWDPFAVLARVDDLNEFDNIVRRTWTTPARNHSWVPPMDLVADGQDVVISLELPGLRANDIDIEVHEGRLTVSGERTDRTSHLSEDAKTMVKELRQATGAGNPPLMSRQSHQRQVDTTNSQLTKQPTRGNLAARGQIDLDQLLAELDPVDA